MQITPPPPTEPLLSIKVGNSGEKRGGVRITAACDFIWISSLGDGDTDYANAIITVQHLQNVITWGEGSAFDTEIGGTIIMK